MTDLTFGIDIGGSGVKGALVELDRGALVGEELRLPTPQPSTPDAVADVVAEILETFDWDGTVGITVPGVVIDGIVRTAPNIDSAWIGTDARELFAKRLALDSADVVVLNDADAAGVAEVRFGDARGRTGCVLVLTFGTGIGSALFIDGTLVPNTEFGHIEVDGDIGERRAAAAAREREGLGYQEWTARVSRYLGVLERMLWPELIILGGGVSKDAAQWVPLLRTRTPLAVASLQNTAGIVGAAAAACDARAK
ncbi:polyphosphate--glucose phosphotransferase [Haloechinothrix sp. LS1_15]|uniref:polyphosphate--glucose phosphotransferase n=1 Tax=Haloechinothrix sp. LS1_15 TaxID=2652248 RepID=UPI002948AAA4|nr:ROK family protein [Haloechinothrix sp. LS1_15]MDV6014463.1 ROK family protein [Haloechinothrix sp. LS1_15]